MLTFSWWIPKGALYVCCTCLSPKIDWSFDYNDDISCACNLSSDGAPVAFLPYFPKRQNCHWFDPSFVSSRGRIDDGWHYLHGISSSLPWIVSESWAAMPKCELIPNRHNNIATQEQVFKAFHITHAQLTEVTVFPSASLKTIVALEKVLVEQACKFFELPRCPGFPEHLLEELLPRSKNCMW